MRRRQYHHLGFITFLLSLFAVACERPPRAAFVDFGERHKANALSIYLSLDEFDGKVGRLRHDISIIIDRTSNQEHLGECTNVGGYLEITVDEARIEYNASRLGFTYEEVFRQVFLHELVHSQLTCSDKDHSADESDLMYHNTNRKNIHAPIPVEAFK